MPPKRQKSKHHTQQGSKELLFKDDEQNYAHILKPLGDRRFHMLLDTGTLGVGKLRGSMRRREYVVAGCTVLCSVRPEESKFDILHKYTDAHLKLLRKYGELEMLHHEILLYNKENNIFSADHGVGGSEDEDLVAFEDGDVEDIIDDI
jgi:translation initiation factor 1A